MVFLCFFFFFDSKKWIYLERNTLHGQSVGHLRRGEKAPAYGVVSFYRLMSGRSSPAISGRGGDFQELDHCPRFNPYGQSWNCRGACGRVI